MKKLLAMLTVFMGCIIGVTQTKAFTETGTLIGPDGYSGQLTQSATTVITSNTFTSIKGNYVNFYVITPGYLYPNVCVADSSRYDEVIVYEDDAYPNADDAVIEYEYGFVGRQMDSAYYYRNYIQTTNIDSAGDPTVELFVTNYLCPIDGDTKQSNGTMFTYKYTLE